MDSELPGLIKAARHRLGIDQAECARRTGVGQQTISRWERGRSRPRRVDVSALAAALELDLEAVLAAAGYDDRDPSPTPPLAIPVRPLVRNLPLSELAPDRFEDLVTEIAQFMYPGSHASRFGGPGEKQLGIDVLVDGQSRATFQCKRHVQFGPGDVANAVAVAEIVAERNYLFLTRPTATAAARTEMTKHTNWELWDGEDISRFIRTEMSKDASLRLVDTYFPGYREQFLGIARPGPWLTSDEFFAPISGDKMFTHDWQLAGRETDRDELLAAIRVFDPVVLLIGRGGIGKTRMLRGISDGVVGEHISVRFLRPDALVRPEDFELLPNTGSLLVAVDDGHERSDIAELVEGVRRRNTTATVLIALRPYGEAGLSQDLRRVGLRLAELKTCHLTDLAPLEAEALAREALGDATDAVVKRLARLTIDCPLATVIGGVLIRRGKLDPSRLEQDDAVRTEIMRGFRDALVADPLGRGATDLRRSVLDAVAALQPFRSDDSSFQNALATLTGLPFDRAQPHLRSLEESGILLRRGRSLRIVPDLLGDVILAQACFDERSNCPTGYLERALSAANGVVAAHLLINACRVDWQVRRQDSDAVSLVSSLWTEVETELKAADLGGRLAMLGLLRKVAYFQPGGILPLLEWLHDNPTTEFDSQDPLLSLYPPTHERVMLEIPPILQLVAYHIDYLPGAMELLRRFAEEDLRPTHQHPQHALRILRDLAEFDLTKPVEYNAAIIDVVAQWFGKNSRVSPFEVLKPMLETEGSQQSYHNHEFMFRPYPLNVEAVRDLRSRIIELAFEEAQSSDLQRAAAATEAIECAMRYPMGKFGRTVEQDELDLWTPEFISTITRLEALLQDPKVDPVTAIGLMRPLRSHADYSRCPDTKSASAAALANLPNTLEFEFSLVLHDIWGHLSSGRRSRTFEERETAREERTRSLVARLAGLSDSEVVDLMERRLKAEREAFGTSASNGSDAVGTIVHSRPSIGLLVTERVLSEPSSDLVAILPIVLGRLADQNPETMVSTMKGLLALEDPQISRAVARSFGWNRADWTELQAGEIEILQDFAVDNDVVIREALVFAIRRLVNLNPQMAHDLVSQVQFSDSPRVADDVFSLFSEHTSIRWEQFSDSQQARMIKQLVDANSIESYHVIEFLSKLSASEPGVVVDLLQERVMKAEAMERLGEYSPVPLSWDCPLQIRDQREFVPILRSIRDWMSSGSQDWVRREMGADIFAAVAGTFDETVLTILEEGLGATSVDVVRAVAACLRKAPRSFVWENVEFVLGALISAGRFGREQQRYIEEALYSATISGVKSGIPGQPFSEDIVQRDKCEAIANGLPNPSAGRSFYQALAESAKGSIRWDADADDRTNDGRDW